MWQDSFALRRGYDCVMTEAIGCGQGGQNLRDRISFL